jgi:glycyl-tRNA synthetase
VWLDGLEITQFTYFQQAGGFTLDPVSVEITYGLERIAQFIQGARSFQEITWHGDLTYGDLHLQAEIEHCIYNFEVADTARLTQLFELFESEARNALDHGLVIPAHDYVLKCSHTFNVLDARGAIGVTERARYFARMRQLARDVAEAYLRQREELGYPLLQRKAVALFSGPSIQQEVVAIEETGGNSGELKGPRDLVFEIGTEELPATDVDNAIAQLSEMAPRLLEEARLDHDGVRVVGTPRRLTVFVTRLAPRQRDVEQVVKGPPARVAYDDQGRPTRAAEGFARSQGVAVDQLQVRSFDGREYAVALVVEKGQPALEVLPELLIRLVSGLHFQRSMRWNSTNVTFSRPIRWLVALLGDQVIPVSYAGVQAGRTTRGLRVAGEAPTPIAKAEDYFKVMRTLGVLADQEERRQAIQEQISRLAASVGGRVPDDPDLLAEVTNLVEQPVALLGRFDEGYLDLPREVLITVMKKHQRYFPVVKESASQSDGLLPYFITVSNGGREHVDLIRAGNEEVIRARYADAAFFLKEDTKRPLAEFVPKLHGLTFQEQLGSMLDKVERLKRLVPILAERLDLSNEERAIADRVTELCKADLVTNMVIEFTSLQGVMGREYALRSGERPEVAQGIYEHYLPRFAGDAVAETPAGIVVGLADRLDSLVGLFAIGLTPTGAADPYGLRRAALGLVQTLIERRISLPLRQVLPQVAALQPVEVSDQVLDDVAAFITRRLQRWLLDAGFRHDLVEAVLAEQGDDPYRAYEAVRAFARWVDTEEFARLLPAYSRSVRIVLDFKRKFPAEYRQPFPLRPEKFVEPATRRLYEAYVACREQVNSTTQVDELFRAMLPLVEPINTFFDDVLVMHEDRELRENRLALLQRIAELPKGIVDLSKVMGF